MLVVLEFDEGVEDKDVSTSSSLPLKYEQAEIKNNKDAKFQKALDYIRAGGKMSVIENKYVLTPDVKKQLIELTTL